MIKADQKRLITVVFGCLIAVAPSFARPVVPARMPSSGACSPPPQRVLDPPNEPTSLRGIWRDLGRLRDAELTGRADQLWELEPELTFKAMILRAGVEIPPTVSANRRGTREADREVALAWIRERVSEDPAAWDRLKQIVRQLLSGTRANALACASARTVGGLREYRLAAELATGLGSPRGEVAHASRQALFTLYLRWFADRPAFEALGASGRELCSEELYSVALEFERTARERGIKLLSYEPQRAATALTDPDPRMRAAAVAALGHVGNGGTADAIARLLEHLGQEIDSGAYLATIDALLLTQAATTPDAPSLRLFREALRRTIDADTLGLQAPAAQALARLPWAESAEGPDSVLLGIDMLVDQLHQLTRPDRLTDRDVLIASLGSLQTLCGRAQSLGVPLAERINGLRTQITELIEDEQELDGVRVASAQLLPMVGTTEDISRAVDVLGRPGSSPEFRYTLLGVLGDMSRELSSDDRGARVVLATLLRQLSGDDTNLRRRALSYLTDEGLEPLTRTADPGVFVENLGNESVPDLQAQLLDLIARHGGQKELERLIVLPNFDAIANGGPAGISGLVQAMRRLAGDQGVPTMRGAERLLAVDNDSTRILRLREVLGLVGSMNPLAAEELVPRHDQAIVRWATELRQAAGSVPGGEAFLSRLVEVHIPGSEGAEDVSATELAHVQALFLSDLIAIDSAAGEAAEVLARFDEAFRLAEEGGDPERCARVRRDRARFLLAGGEEELALTDYRVLFATQLTPEAGSTASVLELGDLRKGGELLFARAVGAEAGPFSLEALRVSLALVGRATWKREPAAVREQDLVDLAGRAQRAGTIEAIELALPFFEGLPELPPEPAEGVEPTPLPAAPEGVIWAGLLESRAVHARLLELRGELTLRRGELASPPSPGGEPPPEVGDGAVEDAGEAGDSEVGDGPPEESGGGGR